MIRYELLVEGQVLVMVALLRLLASSSLDMEPHHMTGEEKPMFFVLVHVHSLCCTAVLSVVDFRSTDMIMVTRFLFYSKCER